jgi:hypothetical protein
MIEKELGKIMFMRFINFMASTEKHRWIANEKDLEKASIETSTTNWILGGRADMVLETTSQFWIIDLKTSSFTDAKEKGVNPAKPEGLKNKFLENKDLFQMIVYDWLAMKSSFFKPKPVRAKLFYLARPVSGFTDPLEKVNGETEIDTIFAEFERIITESLESFCDLSQPIVQTDILKHCAYCAFAPICQR